MPAKKAAPQKAQSSDMGMVWKWVYLLGGLVAALAGAFAFQNNVLTMLLILAGVLVGLFHMDTEDLMGFGIRYLLFYYVSGALGMLPAIGSFLSGFFGGYLGFLGPVALATLFMWFWKKHVASMM